MLCSCRATLNPAATAGNLPGLHPQATLPRSGFVQPPPPVLYCRCARDRPERRSLAATRQSPFGRKGEGADRTIDAPRPPPAQVAAMIDTHLGSARLLDFVADQSLPEATLLELSGDSSKVRWSLLAKSGLAERVAIAWKQPLNQITCGQCRVLVGQRFGIRWLASAVSVFVKRFPYAQCDLYPGDLTVASLIAWNEFLDHAPSEAAQMFAADYGWIDGELEANPADDLLIKARAGLRDARTDVRFPDETASL